MIFLFGSEKSLHITDVQDNTSKYNVGFKALIREGILEPEFYGDLVYKLKKFIGRNDFFFSVQKNHYTSQTYRIILKWYATVCNCQSWLVTMLLSLIARRWVGRQTLCWHRLKRVYFNRLGP